MIQMQPAVYQNPDSVKMPPEPNPIYDMVDNDVNMQPCPAYHTIRDMTSDRSEADDDRQ